MLRRRRAVDCDALESLVGWCAEVDLPSPKVLGHVEQHGSEYSEWSYWGRRALGTTPLYS